MTLKIGDKNMNDPWESGFEGRDAGRLTRNFNELESMTEKNLKKVWKNGFCWGLFVAYFGMMSGIISWLVASCFC